MKFAANALSILCLGATALLSSPARSLDLFDTPKVIEEMSKLPHMQDCKPIPGGKMVAACSIRQIPPRISNLNPLVGNFQNWLMGDVVVFQIWIDDRFSNHDGVYDFANTVISKFSMPSQLSGELVAARAAYASGKKYEKDLPKNGAIVVESRDVDGVKTLRIFLAFKPN